MTDKQSFEEVAKNCLRAAFEAGKHAEQAPYSYSWHENEQLMEAHHRELEEAVRKALEIVLETAKKTDEMASIGAISYLLNKGEPHAR